MGARVEDRKKRRGLQGLAGNFRRDDSGATAVEYTLLIGLIFLAIVAAIRGYTNTTSDMYDEIDQALQDEITG